MLFDPPLDLGLLRLVGIDSGYAFFDDALDDQHSAGIAGGAVPCGLLDLALLFYHNHIVIAGRLRFPILALLDGLTDELPVLADLVRRGKPYAASYESRSSGHMARALP